MSSDNKPWHKQFWPWFLIALPATAVVAGFATLFIAINSSDGMVVDDYYKKGMAINRTLGRDKEAADINAHANLKFDVPGRYIEATIQTNGQTSSGADAQYHLQLSHPTRDHHDVSVILERGVDGVYRADLPELIEGYWHVLLEPIDHLWRLTGRVSLSVSTTLALAAEDSQPGKE